MRRLKVLLLGVLVAASAFDAQAEEEFELGDSSVPVAVNRTRPNGAKIRTDQTFGTLFRMPSSKMPSGAGTHQVMPVCSAGNVRRDEVYQHTQGAENLDALFYDPTDKGQAARAAAWTGRTVPYLASARFNPYYHGYDRFQYFARTLDVRCLPTRFHYVETGGHRYSEYREGARAWEQSE